METVGARYPITIAPWIQSAKLTASDGAAGHGFGQAVAISSDVLVVIAPGVNDHTGATYVFVKPPDGWKNMSETAILAAPVTEKENFGYSVSISNDVIVVGAVQADEMRGEAYVLV